MTRLARLMCIGESIPFSDPGEIEHGFASLVEASTVPDSPARLLHRPRGELRRLARKLLVHRWTHAPASLRPAILRVIESEPSLADAAFDESDPAWLISALEIAALLGRHARADRVVALLRHPERSVSRAAMEALRALMHSPDRVESSGIAASAAIAYPEHRDRATLALVIQRLDLAARRSTHGVATKLGDWALDLDRPEHAIVRSVLKGAPGLARRALELLTSEAFAAAALERTARAISGDEAREIASGWHLSLRPARARRLALARGRHPARGTPTHPPLAAALDPGADVQARRGAARFSVSLGLDDAERDRVLEPLLADPSPCVRRALLVAGGPATQRDLCLDPDPVVAASAALHWSTIGIAGQRRSGASGVSRVRLARALTRSPHPVVRAIARDELERTGLEDPASPAAGIAARRALTDAPDRFDATIRGLLASDDDGALRALGFIRRLGLARRYEGDIATLAKRGASRVAATAAAALARTGSAHALTVLRGACVHDDPRVRANAIESLSRRGQTDRDADAVLLELKPDPHHRVRAAGLRHRLARGEHGHADDLLDMLSHPSPDHRRASIWLIDRHVRAHGWSVLRPRREKLLARLTEAIRGDDAEPVRAWAIRCAKGVLASTRLDWSRSAADVSAGAAA